MPFKNIKSYTHIILYIITDMLTYKPSYQHNVDNLRVNFYLKYFFIYINMVCRGKFESHSEIFVLKRGI